MLKKVFVLLFLLCFTTANATELVSQRAFVKQYIKAVEATYPGVKAKRKGTLEVRMKTADGMESTAFLDNAYNQYRGDPEQLDVTIARFVGALSAQLDPDSVDRQASSLFPVIKNKAYIDQLAALQKESEAHQQIYYEALNEELYVLYVFDTEFSMSMAAQGDIVDAGVAMEALRAKSIENLKSYLPEVTGEGGESLMMIMADGTYDASLLLFDEIWRPEVIPVQGEIVVFVPARDVVLVTGSKDAAGIAQAKAIIASNEWPYFISENAFVRRDGGWQKIDL